MPFGFPPSHWLLAILLSLSASGIAAAAPGQIELGFPSANPNNVVKGVIPQPNGKMIVVGSFRRLAGQADDDLTASLHIARLNADGSYDASFPPSANGEIEGICATQDGKFIIIGDFATLLMHTTPMSFPSVSDLVRFNADGTHDTSFPSAGVGVGFRGMTQQQDGKVIIVGAPASVAGQVRSVFRFNTDATRDTTFSGPVFDGPEPDLGQCVAVQADGKLVIGGKFTNQFATPMKGLARFQSTGSHDSSFTTAVEGTTWCVTVQPDGKILAGGTYSSINGTPTEAYFARLNSDGTVDPSFACSTDGPVYSITQQCDSKIFIAGDFANVNGTACPGYARVNSDGSLDTSFARLLANVSGAKSVTLLDDGRVMISSADGLFRLANDAATENLNVPNSTRVQWLRGGASPEVTAVTFELSTDSGASWTSLGQGSRIGAGWELSGLSLPSSGKLRARAAYSAGFRNATSRFIESRMSLPPAPPNIGVKHAAGTSLSPGAEIAFGTDQLSVPIVKTITVENLGSDDLKAIIPAISGANAADFTVAQPVVNTLLAGAALHFDVTFAATAVGARQAVLTIRSNDPDTPAFVVNLAGNGLGSTNANLASLIMTNGQYEPTFDPGTLSYTSTVQNGVTHFAFTPTVAQPDATITINGSPAVSGSPYPIALNVGSNVFTLVVTAQDQTTTKTYLLNVNRSSMVVPGDVDFDFVRPVDGEVRAVALQSNGKLLLGGSFTSVAGVSRRYLARLNADDTVDSAFNLDLDGEVNCIQVLPTGKILIGGRFNTLTPEGGAALTRVCVALLNEDGTVDPTFDPSVDNEVLCLAVLPDGDILLGGFFQKIRPNGSTVAYTRNYLARVNATGTLDLNFNPNPNAQVNCLALLPDGDIMVGGGFGSFKPNGATSPILRVCLARLNGSGTVDAAFANPQVGGLVRTVMPLPDGKVIITGDFSFAGGLACKSLARLQPNGAVDASFVMEASARIHSTALQADGKLIIGGEFTKVGDLSEGVGGLDRSLLARLNADGSVDAAFNPRVNGTSVKSLMTQENGEIIVGGAFSSVASLSRSNLVRLLNNPQAQSLVPDMDLTKIEWQRSGALPDVSEVYFDVSTDGGATWTLIAPGVRDGTDWNASGVSLPPVAGLLRARAKVVGGQGNASMGWASFVSPYSPVIAEIAVEQPENSALASGDVIDFGTLGVNVLSPLTFSIRNAGGLPLTGVGVTISGSNANQFSVIDSPSATIGGLDSTTFVVRAKVTSTGLKTATLRIVSNDFDENPFLLTLNAVGVAAVLPVATTNAASSVGFGSGIGVDVATATLNGIVDAKGQPRFVTFEYGPTTAYGSVINATPSALSSVGATSVTAILAGLPPHTLFNFRVRIDGDLGNDIGANKTFTTPNHAPVAVNDTALSLPSASAVIDVLDNDTDSDGDELTITAKTAVTPGTAGTLAISANKLVFTASAVFGSGTNSTATFGYTVSDGFGLTATGSVTVTAGGASLDILTATVPSAGVTYPVVITTPGPWAVTESISWASISPAKGIGDATINVSLLPNSGTAARTGTIKIGGVSHTITQAGVTPPTVSAPVITGTSTTGPFNTIVGDTTFSLTIPTTGAPVTYSVVSGVLPPGVSIDQASGRLSGSPSKGGSYPLAIKATNAKGNSSTPAFTINVASLPDSIVGTFHGYVERSSTVNLTLVPDLGARFELTTTATGEATGQLYEGVVKKAIVGDIVASVANPNQATLCASVAGSTHLIDLTFDGANDRLSGTLHDAANVNSANLFAWGNAWSAIPPVKKASAYKALHTFAIENTDLATGPQGFGFANFLVTEKTGVLTITGELPDGSDLLCTTFVGQHGEVLLYQALHGNKGSCLGKLVVSPGNAPMDNTLVGDLTWIKPPASARSKDTVYPEGFPVLPLIAMGSAYPAPAKGQIVMGLGPVAAGSTNAKLDFGLGGLTANFGQLLRIFNPSTTGVTNTAAITPFNTSASPNPNPNKVGLPTLTAATGLFGGSFVISGATAAQNRTAPFAGQVVRIIGTSTKTQGYGYFLLPAQPTGTQTVTTSPKLSGRVQLAAP